MTPAARNDGARTFAVFGLVVMATWTIVIKFVAPILYAVSERAAGREVTMPIMWDFWWVAHLVLARTIWIGHRRARAASFAVAGAETAIVVVKLAQWLAHPDLSFWRLLWFTNKVYVLAFFIVLLAILYRRPAWPAPAE